MTAAVNGGDHHELKIDGIQYILRHESSQVGLQKEVRMVRIKELERRLKKLPSTSGHIIPRVNSHGGKQAYRSLQSK